MTYYHSDNGVASDVKTAAKTVIPSNSAWSLVESTTFGAGSYAADVYKCDHAVSGLSADFYAMVLLNGTSLYLGIAEGYNTSTHKPQRPAMKATSSLVTLESDGGILPAGTELDWYDGTFGGLSVAAPRFAVYSSIPQSFEIVVAKDAFGISAGISSSLHSGSYVGAYDTELGGDDPLPIMMSATTSLSAGQAYATRHPRRGGLSTGYACNLNGAASADAKDTLAAPTAGSDFTPIAAPGSTSDDAYDAYRGSDPGAAKVAVLNSYGATAGIGRSSNGWRRGWIRHVRYTPTSGVSHGDTVSIDGVQYFAAGDQGIWFEMDPA